MEAAWSLLAMCATAFAAATILPFQSEIVFVGLQLRDDVALAALIVVASVGNTLGSVTSYVIGRVSERYRDRRWFPATRAQLERAQRWYLRYGLWTLLLSWAPFGDAITVIAGVLRTPFWIFLVLVALAKTGRYVVLAAATAGLIG